MRIAISTSVIQRGQSGIGQYLLALVRAFQRAATEHEFWLYVLEEDLPLFASVAGSMRLVPVAESHRPPVRNILWHQTVLPGLLQRAGAEILHVPSYRRLLWRRPCALVASICDLAPFRVPGKYSRARMFYGRVMARWLAHRQDEIIAISQHTAQDIVHYFGVPPSRVTVTLLGLDHERFSPGASVEAKERVAERYGVRRSFFLYLARLEHPGKNHVRLIEAFDRFKAATQSDWDLVLGGADWHGAEAIHAAADRSPFASAIHRLGFVAASDLPLLYRAADAFVFPSLHEGFGLPTLEAMACGCPVLSSSRGALAEVVRGAAAIIDPENLDSLRRELAAFAANADRRAHFRALGLQRAQEFDWRKTAEATLAVYARARTRRQKALTASGPCPA